MSQKLSLSLLGLLLLSSSLDAQNPTLRQLAVETQGHIGVSTLGCGPDPTLQSIVSGKDVAIEGTVLSKRGYATADDREIFTDYGFAVSQVILQRKLLSTARPGPPPPMIFKTRGGSVVFDGFPLTSTDSSNGRHVTLQVGHHVVIFGRYDSTDGKWIFGPWDVFYVTNGVVVNELPRDEGVDQALPSWWQLPVFAATVRDYASRTR